MSEFREAFRRGIPDWIQRATTAQLYVGLGLDPELGGFGAAERVLIQRELDRRQQKPAA